MSDPIEKLVIALGLDSDALTAGLQQASRAIAGFGKNVTAGGAELDRLALTASKSAILVNGVSEDVAGRIMDIGTAGQKAAVTVSRAMDDVAKKAGHATAILGRIVAPLAAAFAGGRIIGNLSKTGEELSILSERTGVAIDKIDAWAKANRDAGGSEAAFRAALQQWTVEQGRSADDFFRMGEAVKGMSQQQAAYFMRAMGLSQEAAAVFTKYTSKAQDFAKAYAGSAMTPEQAAAAREVNIQWRRFTDQAQALGNMLAVSVLPIVNKVLGVIGDLVAGLRENGRFVKIMVTGLGALLGASLLRPVLAAAGGFGALFKTIKSGTAITAAFNLVLRANPLGVVITAFTAAAAVLEDFYTFLKGGKSVFESFLQWLGIPQKYIEGWRKTVASFFDALASLPRAIIDAIGSVWDKVKAFGSWVGDLGSSIESLGGLALEAVASIPDALAGLMGSTDELAEPIGQAIRTVVIGGFTSAIDWARNAFSNLADFIGDLIDAALDFGGRLADSITGKVKNALGSIGDFFGIGQDSTGKPQRRDEKTAAPGVLGSAGQIVAAVVREAVPRPEMPTPPAAAGAIAAQKSGREQAGVQNAMEINVTNNIQTTADPQEVGQAVGGAMDNALSRRNRMLVAAQSGVISK